MNDRPVPDPERPVEDPLDQPFDEEEAALQESVDGLPVPDEEREVPPDVGAPPGGDDPMSGEAPSG